MSRIYLDSNKKTNFRCNAYTKVVWRCKTLLFAGMLLTPALLVAQPDSSTHTTYSGGLYEPLIDNKPTALNLPLDSIVRDDEGNPLYFRNEMIVKFYPGFVNTTVVDNRSKQTGVVSEFINSLALQLIIDSGYFNQELANLKITKIHHNLTTAETQSVTRIGDTIEIPKFWSTFLIKWDDSAGMPFGEALDTFNKLWPFIEYAHPNYLAQLNGLPNDTRFLASDQAGLHPTTAFPNCNINIDPAWDLTLGRDNCRIGVL